MQPAPLDVSTNASSEETHLEPTSSLQHGVQHAHGLEHTRPPVVSAIGPSGTEEHSDAVSDTSDATSRGRRSDAGRLSSRDDTSQEGSPGSRVEAYERSHAKARKLSHSVAFQVVPSAAGKKDRVTILDLPNEILTHVLSHLPPETLSLTSLISRRFHRLVTTPPAWRIAFARFFPGAESTDSLETRTSPPEEDDEIRKSRRRYFTRVSALASWRSEYILRTRLLRSLGRGRPAIQTPTKPSHSRHGQVPATAVVTYGSGLLYPVSHMHASFGVGLNKRQPLFVHGAVEQGAVSSSDPYAGKLGNWGLADFEAFKHFADHFPGEAEYGLGAGEVVGMPNVMDVSQPYGKLYGEACPNGRLYYTSTSEQRGRLLHTASVGHHDRGIPQVAMTGAAVTAVWIAKSDHVLKITGGLFGCLAGFSNGVLSAYALGASPVYDKRYERGEPTAKWVLCPGVPIIAVSIDEHISNRRVGMGRMWAVVLNALGEVYHLTDVPARPDPQTNTRQPQLDEAAWLTGRSIEWSLVEGTRRRAKPDPYQTSAVDGSYSPRTSADVHGLSRHQLVAEAQEIERFLRYRPCHFRSICDGWDMRRKLAVDYGGDDGHGAGESILIVGCGVDEASAASVKRVTRRKTRIEVDYTLDPYPAITATVVPASVFGKGEKTSGGTLSSPRSVPRSRTSSDEDVGRSTRRVDWHWSNLSFGELRNVCVSTVALDESDFATLTASEDPLLGMSGHSNASSPIASPLGGAPMASSPLEIPGRRARMMAVGTTNGIVVLWDVRSATPPAPDMVNTVTPVRVIYTKSPQISSLALTSLYVVHGGNDGLVQAWDPLASTLEPLRTLNSRFSDRARRRIAQAEASMHGVGNNYYAAGAIVLDPDPTVLRGMVSLGTHLRFWSYSASAADAYKSRKRGQLRRRSDREGHAVTSDQKYHHTGRGVLKDYITDERVELEREKALRSKERDRLVQRFGTSILGEGASDEDLLAYATMLSEESYASDETKRRDSDDGAVATAAAASAAEGGTRQAKEASSTHGVDGSGGLLDADLEEAIRLSLLDSAIAAEAPQNTASDYDLPIRYARTAKGRAPRQQFSPTRSTNFQAGNPEEGDDDLKFALQLSLAEQQSKMTGRGLEVDDFPALGSAATPGCGSDESATAKGKEKERSRRG